MIITLTMNPTIDASANVENVAPEHKLRCHGLHHEPGGGGINVSRAIKRLGGMSKALYPSGGHNGQKLQDLLSEENMEHETIPVSGLTRENLTIFEESGGQQYRFNMPGAQLSEKEWKNCLDRIETALPDVNYIVASGSLPPGVPEDFYARICRVGHKRDIPVIIDTHGIPLRLAVKEGCFLIKPNMREMDLLTDEKIETEDALVRQADSMIRQGRCQVIVISLGPAGVILMSQEGCHKLRAPTVPIQSKVGAGDSMVAGICIGLQKKFSLYDTVLMGVAAGSAAVMTPGTELCRAEDAKKLYQSMKTNKTGR
jgi:6-phosphofructokinase 2